MRIVLNNEFKNQIVFLLFNLFFNFKMQNFFLLIINSTMKKASELHPLLHSYKDQTFPIDKNFLLCRPTSTSIGRIRKRNCSKIDFSFSYIFISKYISRLLVYLNSLYNLSSALSTTFHSPCPGFRVSYLQLCHVCVTYRKFSCTN